MDPYGRGRSLRVAGTTLGVVLIVAPALYGVLTLVPPLPAATVTVDATVSTAVEATAPAVPLPDVGASAVVAGGEVVATGGSADPVPMAGAAKVVLALASLAEQPMTAGTDGAEIVLTADDVASFDALGAAGARVTPVTEGATWTQRDVLEAVLVGSSNNMAETLARWAFGSVDAYVASVPAWLEQRGLASIDVADATGLDPAGVATGSDLARLGALASADEVLDRLWSGQRDSALPIEDSLAYRTDLGLDVLSRSYTDAAGVVLLARVDLDAAPGERAVVAFAGQPSYADLDAALDAFAAGIQPAIAPVVLLAEGQQVATLTAPWGDESVLSAGRGISLLALPEGAGGREVEVPPTATLRDGDRVGEVVVDLGESEDGVALVATGDLRDPGLAWRITHPVEMLGAFGVMIGF